MAFYISVRGIQSPFGDIGPDINSRPQRSGNFLARTRGTAPELEKEIAKRLQDDGVGTLGTDMIVGLQRDSYKDDTPQIRIFSTSPAPPLLTRGTVTERKLLTSPGFQIIVTAREHDACNTKADAVFDSLDELFD